MVRRCCVVGCNNATHDRHGTKLENGLTFHRFPAWKQTYGDQISEITKSRRLAWIAAVRRPNITFHSIPVSMRVCSRHFHSGKPANEMQKSHPDWAPSLHLGHTEIEAAETAQCEGKESRKRQRTESTRVMDETEVLVPAATLQMFEATSSNTRIKVEESDSESHPDGKRLSCFFCAAEFPTAGLLTIHTSGHTGEKLKTCVLCKEMFGSESELVGHRCGSGARERIPADEPLRCSQCGKGFPTREDLNLHLRVHPRGKPFSCSVCGAGCCDRDSLVHHMRLHTRQTQFTCHVCGKDFAWRRHLTKHMEVHSKRKKVFRCRVCAAEFHTYYLLSKHKGVHQTPELPLDQTEEGARDAANIDSDTSKETNMEVSASFKTENDSWDDSFSPNISPSDGDETFNTGIRMKLKEEDPTPPFIKEEEEEMEILRFNFNPVPMKTEVDDEEKPRFLQLPQTEEREERLEGEDPGTTEKNSGFSDTDDSECWKPSSSNSDSDSGRNPSSCSDNKPQEPPRPDSDDSVDSDFWKDYKKPPAPSPKPARQEPSEKGAKYVTDLKPYSCPQCGKAFRYGSYLKIHMKQHTDRYFCSVCGHKSTSSSNLKVHIRTHTGEKPFSCSLCDKKYTNKASMLSHMSVHDAERKYSCDACKKSFAWYTELKYHQCVGESSGEQLHEEDARINLKQHTLYS